MKVAVIGAGGVGGYFGGMIARAGYDVTFLARGEHLKAIQTNGLKINSQTDNFLIRDAQAVEEFKDIGKSDLIILGVKAWQVREIAPELPGIMHDGTVILPLQNGVVTYNELKDVLGPKNLVAGLCRIFSLIEVPGIIRQFGIEPSIVFGEIDNNRTERVTKIKEVFDASGINSKIAEDIESELWKKFIGICISGLLAVTRSTYGEILELKETKQMTIDLFNEIFTLSQKIGIKINSDFVEKTVSFLETVPYESTASLTRDVMDGKPSEIEYQNGTVVRLAEKYGVDTPVNKFIYHCILPMEYRARNKANG